MVDLLKSNGTARDNNGIGGVVFLLALVAILFLPWWLEGRVLAPLDILEGLMAPWNEGKFQSVPRVHNHFVSDAVTQYLPYALFAKTSFVTDGRVGWNPMVFGGVAQHANTMALYYDWSSQLYRWTGFWTAWHLGRMAQFFLAGLGMLVFLRSQKCGPGIALLGSVAYLLNTQFVVWIYHHWAIASFCWAPWLIWSLYRTHEGSQTHAAWAICFVAMCLLGGTLQHAAFVLLLLGCVWAGWIWEGKGAGIFVARSTVVILVAGFFGACIVATFLEATVSAYLDNLRAGQVRGGLGYLGGMAQPLLNFPSIVFYAFPSLLGNPQSLDFWKVFKSDFFNIASFGTLPVILAWVSLAYRRTPRPAWLLMVLGLVLPLTPLVGPLYHRVQLLWILGGCWGAAIWLRDAPRERLKKLFYRLDIGWLAFAGIWFVASLFLWGLRGQIQPWLVQQIATQPSQGQFGIFSAWVASRVDRLFIDLPIWNGWQLMLLGGAGLSILSLGKISSRAWAWRFIPALGVAIQGMVFWWQWTTWSAVREEAYERPSWVAVLKREVGLAGRLAQAPGGYPLVPLGPNTLQPAGVSVAGGYDSIFPKGMKRTSIEPWEFLGTTHYLGPVGGGGPKGWPRVHQEGGWQLLKNPDPAVGLVWSGGPDARPLALKNISRSNFNSMEVELPAGTRQVEIFSNWHRGWKWRLEKNEDWNFSQPGPHGGTGVNFKAALPASGKIFLRYDSRAPAWASGLVVLAISAMAAILFGRGKSALGLFNHLSRTLKYSAGR